MSHGERRDRLPGRGIRPLPDRIPGGDAPVDWDAGNAVRPIPRPSHRGPLRGGRGPNDVFELNRRRLRNGEPRPPRLHAFFDRRRQCPGGRERDRRVPQSRRPDDRPAELQPDRLRPSPNRPKQRASDAGGFGSPGSLPLLLPCPGRRHVGAKHPGRRTLGDGLGEPGRPRELVGTRREVERPRTEHLVRIFPSHVQHGPDRVRGHSIRGRLAGRRAAPFIPNSGNEPRDPVLPAIVESRRLPSGAGCRWTPGRLVLHDGDVWRFQ